MFQSLFKRAEATVDQAVTSLILKIAVAIPFLLALGFFTAAATVYVSRKFEAEVGYLIMTSAFLVVGGLAAIIVHSRNSANRAPIAVNASETGQRNGSQANSEQPASEPDREMLMAALAAVGPAAAPAIVRLVLRNLPLVAAIAAASFIVTRPGSDTNVGSGHVADPAE